MESKHDPTQEIPEPSIVDRTFEWLYYIGAFRAALDLNIWQRIATGDDSVQKLAAREGWDQTGTRVLLDAMVALKLLRSEGDRYTLVPESEYYLVPGKPTYKGDILLGEYGWEGNGKLAESIRLGNRPINYDATTPDVVKLWISDYSRNWVFPEVFLETAGKRWQSLGIQARAGLQVLDLACGPAPNSLVLAHQHPEVRLTWVDWDEILQVAIKVAAELGVADQVAFLPGDLWQVDFGTERFDVAYLGNVTHFFNSEENTILFRKVHAALLPGGLIVINSVARRENETAATAGLWLYAATASGGIYDFMDYREMLEKAGFSEIMDINKGPIKAIKP